MLSAEAFNISAGFQIWLPISDYYTVDGYQIDQKGVLPNIKVKSTDALNYVINNLLK
jgi:C-terminal processing protease CtpA/Prc